MSRKKTEDSIVLAFEKKLVVSDGYMYGTNWDHRDKEAEPVKLVEKTVRGTISNRLKEAAENDPAKLNAAIQNPNPHTIDSASLTLNQDTLKLVFTVKVLSGVQYPSACSSPSLSDSIKNMGGRIYSRAGIQRTGTEICIQSGQWTLPLEKPRRCRGPGSPGPCGGRKEGLDL